MAASAHWDLRGWKAHLGGRSLADLSPCVNNARDKSDKDGGNAAESDRSIKEDETADGDWELVQSTNHGVGGRGGDTDAPCGGVGDEDGSKSRVDHGHDLAVAGCYWEVLVEVGGRPVLDDEGQNDQDWNGEEVVVEHSIPILKVHLLDDLAHAQEVRSSEEDVQAHPGVTSVQRGHLVSSIGVGTAEGAATTVASKCVLDISPGSNDRAENHESEGEEGRWSDAAAKPENLSICDNDDGQVLEDGVNWDRQELKSLGAGVDHSDKKKGDWEP